MCSSVCRLPFGLFEILARAPFTQTKDFIMNSHSPRVPRVRPLFLKGRKSRYNSDFLSLRRRFRSTKQCLFATTRRLICGTFRWMNPYLHNIWDGRSSKLAHVTTTINHTREHAKTRAHDSSGLPSFLFRGSRKRSCFFLSLFLIWLLVPSPFLPSFLAGLLSS